MPAQHFDLDRLRAGVRPFRLHFFTRLKSTNDHAALLRRRKRLFAPAIVLAARQLKGRGRGGNEWWSGEGSVTLTFVLPTADHHQPHQIPLLAGLAVRRALADLSGSTDLRLKWPNDVLLDDAKVGGLLCERLEGADLLGVGLNVNVDPRDIPARLRGRAGSLIQAVSDPIDVNDVVISLARAIHGMLSRPGEPGFGAALREYDRHHALMGRRISVIQPGDGRPATALVGTCTGLDSMGRLLVRDRGGRQHRVISGSIALT